MQQARQRHNEYTIHQRPVSDERRTDIQVPADPAPQGLATRALASQVLHIFYMSKY